MPLEGDRRKNVESMKIGADVSQIDTSSSRSMTTSTGNSADDSSSTSTNGTSSSLSPLSIDSCVYRGEGNANVVIALPHERKVIRFRKSLPDEVPPDGGKVRVQREVEFVRNVISGFLGSYARIPEIVRYDTDDIARLSEAIRSLRPEKRCCKDITEVHATKFPDYTFLPPRKGHKPFLFRNKSTFCVEIKPKQGYLRKVERRFQKCPYCLTQYYKLKKKSISSRSSYCPFDLFSGVRERMKVALTGLLESPQNNLKIFKDGNVVYDQESSINDLERVLSEWFRNSAAHTKETYTDTFCNLICSALLHEFDKEELQSNIEDNLQTLIDQEDDYYSHVDVDTVTKAKKLLYFTQQECNFDSQGLPENSVLKRIYNMQRLPYGNTETIYNIYSKYSNVLKDDMVYSNFRKCHNMYNKTIYNLSNKHIDGLEKKKISKETDWFLESLPVVHGTHKGDSNKNQSIESACSIWSICSNFYAKEKNTMLRREMEWNNDCSWRCTKAELDEDELNEENENVLRTIDNVLALRNYLLFCTARDCSILIAFREVDPKAQDYVPEEHVIKASEEQYFLTNIGVSDLDPKSVHSVKKHKQRDTDVLNSVISILEEELATKNCSSIEH